NFGVLEGLPFGALQDAAAKENISTAIYKPENGESNIDMRERAADYFKDLCDLVFNDPAEPEQVALFTHGGWMRELCIHLISNHGCALKGTKGQCATQVSPNTGVTSLLVKRCGSGKIQAELLKWHDISHLDPDQPVIKSLGI
ncbi:hypothetical protein QYM36_018398, partial [Artemia franciscana]